MWDLSCAWEKLAGEGGRDQASGGRCLAAGLDGLDGLGAAGARERGRWRERLSRGSGKGNGEVGEVAMGGRDQHMAGEMEACRGLGAVGSLSTSGRKNSGEATVTESHPRPLGQGVGEPVLRWGRR